jgi:hypothetical protein
MKNSHKKSVNQASKKKGFTLIVTLSFMILLTLVVVGLLSLSSISMRISSQGNARATARANARLALMLAIGDLQKFTGPDQRVTARADILDLSPSDTSRNPRLTGVWRSSEIVPGQLPQANDYNQSTRDNKFLGWLTSSMGNSANGLAGLGYAKSVDLSPAGSQGNSIALWDRGTLGSQAPGVDIVNAAKIPTNKSRGAIAWATLEENTKARVNTPYVDQATTRGAQTAQLGSGERPNTASIKGLSQLRRNIFEQGQTGFSTVEKGITRKNLELAVSNLADPSAGEAMKLLTHDVTGSSVGLFTDVARGGLKEDFNLLTNTPTPPTNYSRQGIYRSLLGITGPSDPLWESLFQYARIYQDSRRISSSGGIPAVRAQGPAGWTAAAGSDAVTGNVGVAQLTQPPGVVLMPTIAKVQLFFSLLTRDIYNYPNRVGGKLPGTKEEEAAQQLHSPWGGNLAGSEYDYLLHMLYTPVVTLHNPYNVALEFNELKVVFGNVPFAMQVFRNGQAQTNSFAPLDTMYHQNSQEGTVNKRFGMTLKTNGGTQAAPSVGSPTFRLLPGEVVMFSPYIDPNRTWATEVRAGGGRVFFDFDSNSTRTLNIDGIPGWRGDGIGFDLDWFCPTYQGLRVSSNETEGSRQMPRAGCIAAKAGDNFSVKFAPLSVPTLSNNKYSIEMFVKPTVGANHISSGLIEMDYENPKGLQNYLLGPDGSITYPKTGTINALAMHTHSSVPIKNIATSKPFAVISAQAKTTLGGFDPSGEDGKIASKPWLFGHASIGTSTQKVVTEHPAHHSHEISLLRLDSGTNNLLQFDPATGRGNFITGLTGSYGSKFGAMYDVPLAPLQSLVTLNGANPGGSSAFLPRFAQPIGNSWAHPSMNSTTAVEPGGVSTLMDHSFLLNRALYDRFYFSGLADQTGNFGTGKASPALAAEFSSGLPLVDPRVKFYVPDGKAPAALVDEMKLANIHTRIASWQLMYGSFNINSTSVAAWKAMLGSIHDSQAIFNNISTTTRTSTLTNLFATDASNNEARISRFRLPASQSAQDGGVANTSYWLGAREYSDADLQRLAERIVEQVKLRGPFLSLSEFVNRRLGPATDERTQRGALQHAIDNTDLNQLQTRKELGDITPGYNIEQAAVSQYKYRNILAGTGSSFQGAPGFLSQADLLSVLGNATTARSDTFTIRGYGEARDGNNNIIANATCEAIVQRIPEYIDPTDEPFVLPAQLRSGVNRYFGRRYTMVSFRWLSRGEI